MTTATATKTINWTAMERKLTEIAKNFLMEAYGMELEIPVKVNGRLTRTLGWFVHGHGRGKSLRIEMGKKGIEHQAWEDTVSTLKHECIHYALYELGKPYKDGEKYFEDQLRKHGAHSTGTIKYKGAVEVYKCACCGGTWRKRRKFANNGKYHRHCGEPIIYVGKQVV